MVKSRQTHPLRLPGIQDVVFERLSGTFNVYLYGISPDVPASLLAMAQAQIDRSTAFPLSGTALAPDLIGITLSTTLTLAGSLSSADAASVVAAAQSAAADYINNLGVGETLVLNEIADRIRSSDARIFDVGRPNQPLEEVFLWRSCADVGDVSAEIHSSLIAGIPGFPRVPRPRVGILRNRCRILLAGGAQSAPPHQLAPAICPVHKAVSKALPRSRPRPLTRK